MMDDSPPDAEIEFQQHATNEALAQAGLLENPVDEEGLVFPLPADAVIQSIVSSYDTKGTGRKVRCSACPQHQQHYRGFRVALKDGRQARLGIDCGENHFGKDAWGSVRADFNRRVELVTFQARIQPSMRIIERVEPLIREWHGRTNKLAKWLGTFRRELPQLAEAVSAVCQRRSGRLQVERLVRREGVNARGQRYVRREPEIRVLGRVPHPRMFLGYTPTHGLNGAARELAEALQLLGSRSDAPSLAKAFRAMQRARQYLNEADEAHAGALSNLDESWLTALCQWANQTDGMSGEYWVEGRGLFHSMSGKDAAIELLGKGELGPSGLQRILAAWDGAD